MYTNSKHMSIHDRSIQCNIREILDNFVVQYYYKHLKHQ